MHRRLKVRFLVAVLLIGSAGRTIAKGADPRLILDLGSEVVDGSITLACAGKEPYPTLSCTVYRLSVKRLTAEQYRTSRASLQESLAAQSFDELRKAYQFDCSQLASRNKDLQKNLQSYSPGRAASEQSYYEYIKAVCACRTKECILSAQLADQARDQNRCTVYSTVFPVDFVKVSGRKWVSNNGPEGICGVVSVFTLEHEPDHENLWNYTEQYIYTNKTGGLFCVCEKLKDEAVKLYSWKSPFNVQLNCQELRFKTDPEWR